MRLRQRGLGLLIYVRATIATRDDLIATLEFECECECGIWCGNGVVQRSRCFGVRMCA